MEVDPLLPRSLSSQAPPAVSERLQVRYDKMEGGEEGGREGKREGT
jgi:hypothetical protein